MLGLILLQLTLQLICIFYSIRKEQKRKYENQKILIIGGTSGLGLSLALKLSNWNDVTVTGRRKFDTKYLPIKYLKMDVTEEIEFDDNYDVIFYCAGYAIPKYFEQLEIREIRDEFEVNFFGAVKSLKRILQIREKQQSSKQNEKAKLDFILIGSPLSFFTLPGYSAYSCTKSALFCLFSTIRPEMKLQNIELFFYILSNTKTSGFEQENRTKPEFTKNIEQIGTIASADERADSLLRGMLFNHVVHSDTLVALMRINFDSLIVRIVHSLVIQLFYRFH